MLKKTFFPPGNAEVAKSDSRFNHLGKVGARTYLSSLRAGSQATWSKALVIRESLAVLRLWRGQRRAFQRPPEWQEYVARL